MKRSILILTALILIAALILPAAAVGPIVPNPDAVASRAIVIDALYRREGSPEIADSERNDFPDSSVQWYADAASWGKTNGIVFGNEDGSFHGERAVTRAELAVMLYRYAQFNGCDVTAEADENGTLFDTFEDRHSLPAWSVPAFGRKVFGGVASLLPEVWGALLLEVSFVLLRWLVLLFLYRRRIFLRV